LSHTTLIVGRPMRVSILLLAACGVANLPGPAVADITETAKLVASDGAAGDELAFVSISGQTLVAGALFDDGPAGENQGSAYVFEYDGTAWTQVARLTPSDAAAGDWFGVAVAISGDTIVIGARFHDGPAGADQGAAYLFVRPAGGWTDSTESCRLAAPDAAAGDQFGNSVSISGDTVVVGAYSADNAAPGSNQGAAYVFTRPTGGWPVFLAQAAKLVAAGAGGGDSFGIYTAVSADTVVVGAHLRQETFAQQGAAYVFVKPAAGWSDMTETAKLVAADAQAADFFGFAVAIDGPTVAIGADGDDGPAGSDQGAVYVFERPPGGWAGTRTQTAKLTASDAAAVDLFGYVVSVSGGVIVTGVNLDDAPLIDQGSAYVFVRPPGGWSDMTETCKLVASDGQAGDELGYAAFVDGDFIAVGAGEHDGPGGEDQGAVYFFLLDSDGDGVPESEDVCPATPAGVAVDCEGRPRLDLNGDCRADAADIPLIVDQLLAGG
jgi:hypothetical protein